MDKHANNGGLREGLGVAHNAGLALDGPWSCQMLVQRPQDRHARSTCRVVGEDQRLSLRLSAGVLHTHRLGRRGPLVKAVAADEDLEPQLTLGSTGCKLVEFPRAPDRCPAGSFPVACGSPCFAAMEWIWPIRLLASPLQKANAKCKRAPWCPTSTPASAAPQLLRTSTSSSGEQVEALVQLWFQGQACHNRTAS